MKIKRPESVLFLTLLIKIINKKTKSLSPILKSIRFLTTKGRQKKTKKTNVQMVRIELIKLVLSTLFLLKNS